MEVIEEKEYKDFIRAMIVCGCDDIIPEEILMKVVLDDLKEEFDHKVLRGDETKQYFDDLAKKFGCTRKEVIKVFQQDMKDVGIDVAIDVSVLEN